MKDNIIITNKDKVNKIKERIISGGPDKLHVVSDFDKTLTSCFVNGEQIVSLISLLRDENYLTSDYSKKAKELYKKYHKKEIDLDITIEEKKKAMHEWWASHYALLFESGLNIKDLEKVAQSNKISLRPGALDFFDFLNKHNIPLLILSAAGVGAETISLMLRNHQKLFANILIASNTFILDDEGNVTGVNDPIIHSYNKDYTSVKRFSFYKKIKERKNVILLGDGIGDAAMVDGFEFENIIKIGFLNENSKGQLAKYKASYDIIILNDGSMDPILNSFKDAFDVIILGDGSMNYINSLLREILKVRKQ